MPKKRRQEYGGPVLLSYGFRPFFLLASIYAAMSILVWIPFFYGHLEVASDFTPVDWHMHELVFGFATAVICGFLYTAVPNWTGRLPVQGLPLLCMVLLWAAGRVAVTFSVHVGWFGAMIIDCAFLFSLWAVIAIEIIKGRNWRNLKVLLPLSILFGSNIAFHIEAHFLGSADYSKRTALAVVIAFILLIGGRIIPSFTRNWLVKFNQGRLPQPFGLYEKASLGASVITLASWVAFPASELVGYLFVVTAGILIGQLARWAGDRTLKEPLVFILHSSYFFTPLGFWLLGVSILFPEELLPVVGVHALGTGAIANMILSVMTRATKGHTGRELTMARADYLIFGSIMVTAIARILAAIFPDQLSVLLEVSAITWIVAFMGFAVFYSGALMKSK
jgi:uncharacterized protein involved in response to NO